ncbi:hypothetical protein ABT224_20045 [Streptomyces sp. NPDC001584]|uniref:hypothetical protein n=1 Tax=Streptomyces sp. NPDC001584 TaxID=3154521 RepID=UPI00332B334B
MSILQPLGASDTLTVSAAYVPRSDLEGQARLVGPAPLKEWTWTHASPHAAPSAPAVDDILFFATTTANARAKPGSWSEATFPVVRVARITSVRQDAGPDWATVRLVELRRIYDCPGAGLGDLAEALRRAAAQPAGVPRLFPVEVPAWISLLLQ